MKKILALFILTCSISSVYADYSSHPGSGYGQSGYNGMNMQAPQYQGYQARPYGPQGGNWQGQDMNQQYRYNYDNGQQYNSGSSYYNNGSNLYGDEGSHYSKGNSSNYQFGNDGDRYSSGSTPSYRYNSSGNSSSYNSDDKKRSTNGSSSSYGNSNSLWGDEDSATGSLQNNMQKLTSQLRDSLQKELSKYSNVKVILENGKITLKGTVPSQQEKDAIDQKLRRIPGAQNIDNQITIQK
jgi:osmotically-inducible protein OsmY